MHFQRTKNYLHTGNFRQAEKKITNEIVHKAVRM